MKTDKTFGLVGRNISYSFSRNYFTKKFAEAKLDTFQYVNFDLPSITDFPAILKNTKETLSGMNVTIPYKEEIFQFLDEIDAEAREIGAVNTIKVLDGLKLKGFNTDVYGFEKSIEPCLTNEMNHALILGTGGASKAVAYAFKKRSIAYKFVSRTPKSDQSISYNDLNESVIKQHPIIVNCSPLGTFPSIEQYPNIPYEFLTSKHLLFDLIYNPSETTFLKKGKEMGARIQNGENMLRLQADKSWEIWNS